MSDSTGTSSYRLSLSFPLFYSFVLPTHPLLYSRSTCSTSAQPSSRKAAFPPSSVGQENSTPPSQKVGGITQENNKAAQLSEITNTLEHINDMGPWPRCRLKGNSSKALTLIPITSSSNSRQTTIPISEIKHPVHSSWLGPDPERHY